MRLVIDTTYRRTIAGRILGYCNLELNLSGHPGLRSLTRVPNADRVYALILRLLSGHEDELLAEPEPERQTAPGPEPRSQPEPRTEREPGAGDTVRLGYVDQSRDALVASSTVWQEISEGQDEIDLGRRKIASRIHGTRSTRIFFGI